MTTHANKHNQDADSMPTTATALKQADPFVPRMLTQAEIEDLRQHKRQCHEAMMELLRTMDLSRLKG